MIETKICGLTTAAAVDAAVAGGAAYLGFMFFPASPRNIEAAAAARLAQPARGQARIVAVAVDPDDDLLDRLRQILAPDFIQLHGRESPSRVQEVGRRAAARVIKVVPVTEAADLATARVYDGVADHLMFDAKPPAGADRPGGLGAPVRLVAPLGRAVRTAVVPGRRPGPLECRRRPSGPPGRRRWMFLLAWSAAPA